MHTLLLRNIPYYNPSKLAPEIFISAIHRENFYLEIKQLLTLFTIKLKMTLFSKFNVLFHL